MSQIAYMVDRLTDELHRACRGALPPQEARAIADRMVVEFLNREAEDADLSLRARGAVQDIRRLTLKSARADMRDTLIPKGQIFDILDRWGLR